jgi:fused signal recognition particle receptor
MGIFKRLFGKEEKENLDKGLEKTKNSFFDKISLVLRGKNQVDDEVLDELEMALLEADVGVKTTVEIIKKLQESVKKDKYLKLEELNERLRGVVTDLMNFNPEKWDFREFSDSLPHKPYVILVVGVNGVGKTTTIGKLAHRFKEAGKQVMLGAADTFRAAAVDQLKIWGERSGVPVISQGMNADPASVAFDTVQSAKAKGSDVVLIDTAGRLHNKTQLMNELSKIRRVIQKVIPDAPHEVLLVLDGSTGQNAFEQCRQFMAATEVSALAVTKLDGTAKGGVVIGLSHEFNVPVKFIGVGEKIHQLQFFDAQEFTSSLFKF